MKLNSKAGLVLIVGVALVSVVWLLFNNATSGADEAFGQWGDKFGALNCLFAGTGFVAIVATLVYQHDENKKKEQETKELMEQLRRTAEALENQARTIEQTRYLDALVARIEGYTVQFKVYEGCGNISQLTTEQDQLLWELADVLDRFRTQAGGTIVTPEEVARRLRG